MCPYIGALEEMSLYAYSYCAYCGVAACGSVFLDLGHNYIVSMPLSMSLSKWIVSIWNADIPDIDQYYTLRIAARPGDCIKY